MPLGNDQPGVAARVAAHGAGVVIPRRKLNPHRLRNAVRMVLEKESFRAAAHELKKAMQEIDGLARAADLIESALVLRPVQQSA